MAFPAGAQKKGVQAPAGIDPSLMASLTWRELGPFRGGRSCAVAGVPDNPNLYYFGATGGGVWRTRNGGNTWENISDGFFGGSIGAVEVSRSDNNIIFAGEGEKTVRGNVSTGFGLWKSADGGTTWEHSGLTDTRIISRIRIHPENPDVVYVAALGDLYRDSEARGVYKTTDGGKTWRRVLFTDAGSGAVDLTFDPSNPRILYASTWTVRRTPWSLSSGGSGSKLWKSTDSGETWVNISGNQGFPKGLLGIIGVAVSPANPSRVWAMVENEPDGGLYRSENGGASWQRINSDRNLRQRAWYYTRIYADTRDAERVYVLNVSFHASNDGGRTFTTIRTPHGDHHDLWIAPENPERMIVADDGGAQVSFDRGRNWSTMYNQPTAQFYRVTTDSHFPFRIYGAQQDNSSVRLLHRSEGSFITDSDWERTAGGEAGHHAPYPENPDIVLGGEYGGLMIRLNHRTGETQAVNVWPNNPMGHGASDMKYRFQWNYPIFFSRHDSEKLYTFSNHVHLSTDFGRSWKTISPDLTTNDITKQGPSGGPITKDNTSVEYYCTIFAAAESFTSGEVIWTGSDDGLIHLTRNGGGKWENVTPAAMPKFAQINTLEADPFNEGGLFVVATCYKLGDYQPLLYHTADYGRSWRRIDTGIDRLHFTRVIRAEPARKGLLFAGTEYGLYISFNNGEWWQPFRNNFPMVPVTDLAVRDRSLIAATQGRGFWMIDDLSPLYEMVEGNTPGSMHLYKPKPTWLLNAGSGGRSLTEGENHPAGAIINYYLKEVDPEADYRIVFRNSSGESVKTFSSRAGKPADRWQPVQGAGRFVWNLRTDGIDEVEGMIMWSSVRSGPYVTPGEYTVSLEKGTEKREAELMIVKDPRIDVTGDDLAEQYRFIKTGIAKLNAVNQAIREIRKVNGQLADIAARVENPSLKGDIASLAARAGEIEKALYQTQNRSAQDPLNYPIRLNNKYGHLIMLAGMGFNRPTEQMYGVREELETLIDAELAGWDEIKKSLTGLNERIRAAGVPYIVW